MRFEEQVQVPVSQAEAWAFIWQTQRLAGCLPGCKSVQEIEPGKAYVAQFEDAIGPYKVGFQLDVTVLESVPQDRVHVRAAGEDKRLRASQQVDLVVVLRPQGERSTLLDVVADVVILGKIATLGQFAIKRKAKDVVQGFARNIAAALQPGAAGGAHA